MQRYTLVNKVHECLSVGLQNVQVGLLKPIQPYPDLTQIAQLTIKLLSERQASELQAKGTEPGVTYGPASNKNLSPNPCDRRVISLQLELELEDTEQQVIARLDQIINEAETFVTVDEMPVPWQHFIAMSCDFSFRHQAASTLGKAVLIWDFYYQVEPPAEPDCPPITQVYLGQKDEAHHLIYDSQNL